MANIEDPVFFDSTILINFGEIHAFDVLMDLYSRRAFIAEEVKQEILDKSYRTEEVLKKYMNTGSIKTVTLKEPGEPSRYSKLSQHLDSGEAATIVAASRNNGVMATDDRDARRIARNKENLKVTGSVGILLRSISQNLKTVQEADRLHETMIQNANYFSPIRSLTTYIEERDLDLN